MSLLGFVVWGIPAYTHALCVPTAESTGRNVAYRYAAAYIDSLMYAELGSAQATRAEQAYLDSPSTSTLADFLAALELAARDYECSASLVGAYTQVRLQEAAPTDDSAKRQDEMLRRSAHALAQAYSALALHHRLFGAEVQHSLKETTSEGLVRAASDFIVRAQRALEMVRAGSPMVAHLLVDSEADVTSRPRRLRITERERRSLVRAIDGAFGARARREAPPEGRPAVEGAAFMLRKFLTQAWKTREPR